MEIASKLTYNAPPLLGGLIMKLTTNLYSNVTNYLATLNRDTKAATAIEYAVIAGLMALALITALAVLTSDGGGFATFFDNIAAQLGFVAEEG